MPDSAGPVLTHTDKESVLREALTRLITSARHLDHAWATADPIERGLLWGALRKDHEHAAKALQATPDSKPWQCAHTWFSPLDNVWDRCGLPLHHKETQHLAEYMVNAGRAEGEPTR